MCSLSVKSIWKLVVLIDFAILNVLILGVRVLNLYILIKTF